MTTNQILEIRQFHVLVNRLAYVLLQLAQAEEIGKRLPDDIWGDSERFEETLKAERDAEVFGDLAFVYFRRLADCFARAARFLLFDHVDSAPRTFKRLRDFCIGAKLPMKADVNPGRLQGAFQNHTKWFDLLTKRPESDTFRKGVRDSLEHHPVWIEAHLQKDGDGPWWINLQVGWPQQREFHSDLLRLLKEMVEDLCKFWTSFCSAITTVTRYECWPAPGGDCFVLGGKMKASHFIAFWPQLGYG